ncbi:MAG TPA: hypothetical protein VIF60_07445 [Burkholderiaceae bacterium]
MSFLPGWNSIELASKIHTWFEVAGIIVLAVLVLTETISLVYSARKDSLLEEKSRAEEVRQKEDAAARLRERKLDAENKQLILAQLEEAKKESADAKVQTAKIKEQVAPRRLSADQRKELIAALAPFKGQQIDVFSVMGDSEGRQFAESLIEILRAAGWDAGPMSGLNQAIFTGDVVGIQVGVNKKDLDGARVPNSLEAFVNVLIKLHLLEKHEVFANDGFAAGKIRLNVGRKPPGG